ncbi:MAG: hypothetical protein U0P46_08290 [Holophagaceae bacterium]
MLLGTGTWAEGGGERKALVARLASGRLADLNRIEAIRLQKLGEGEAGRLAEVLVPPSLRRVLEGGPRALARVRQAVAYAEKWDRRGTLPADLAPAPEAVSLGPCLPQPSRLRCLDGPSLDRQRVQGNGSVLPVPPQPTLAVLGQAGGGVAGICLALEGVGGAVLGSWMLDAWPEGDLELRAGGVRRTVATRTWEGLDLPLLKAGEVLLLPPPRIKTLPSLPAGGDLRVRAGFDTLHLRYDPEGLHPTVQ